MILIAATTHNNVIGQNGNLACRLPEDMRHFREKTMGQTIIVGRKTFDTFKDGLPLPGRTNIVLTRDDSFEVPGVLVAHQPEEVHSICLDVETEIYVAGGQSVYERFWGWCDRAIITRIDQFVIGDAFFPPIETMPNWKLIGKTDVMTSTTGVSYWIEEYHRV